MTRNICITIAIGLLLAACETPFIARDDWARNCQTSSNVNLNVGYAKIQAQPGNRCLAPGELVVFNVSPRKWPLGTVRIEPKSTNPGHPQSDGWLTGSNAEDGQFTITAPDYAHFEQFCDSFEEGECLFGYEVFVDDVGMLDPMFTIRR